MSFFCAMIFMICVFWRPQVWLFPQLMYTGYLDGVIAVTVLALLFEFDEGRIKRPKRYQVLMILGLYCSTLISHVAHTYLGGILNTWLPMLKYTIYAVILLCVTERVTRVRTVIRIFVSMGLFMTWHAYLQVTRGYGLNGSGPVLIRGYEEVRTRFFGIFGDPNDLAQMLVVCMPLAFAFPRRMNFFKLLLCCGAAYILVWGMISTGSRGGYVGTAAILGTGLIFLLPRKWTPVLLLLAVLSALTLMPAAGLVLDSSARNRVIFWGMANWQFKANPLFGLGFGMFWKVTKEAMAAHNAFVHCYTEIGYVGYWFWFGLMLLGVVSCWRTRVLIVDVDHPEARYLSRASACCITAMIGYAASSYFLSRAFIYPYFFLCILLTAFSNVAEEFIDEEDLGEPIIKPWRDVLVLNTLGSGASIIYIYWSIILLNRAL